MLWSSPSSLTIVRRPVGATAPVEELAALILQRAGLENYQAGCAVDQGSMELVPSPVPSSVLRRAGPMWQVLSCASRSTGSAGYLASPDSCQGQTAGDHTRTARLPSRGSLP